MDIGKVQALQQAWEAGLVFYTIVAATYWIDATRWAKEAQIAKSEPQRQEAEDNVHKAERLFKIASALAAGSLVAIALPVWIESNLVYEISKLALVIPVVAVVGVVVYYIRTGEYIVGIGSQLSPSRLDTSYEDLEVDQTTTSDSSINSASDQPSKSKPTSISAR